MSHRPTCPDDYDARREGERATASERDPRVRQWEWPLVGTPTDKELAAVLPTLPLEARIETVLRKYVAGATEVAYDGETPANVANAKVAKYLMRKLRPWLPVENQASHHALLVALRQYGQHKYECKMRLGNWEGPWRVTEGADGYPCTCGFSAALQLAEEGTPIVSYQQRVRSWVLECFGDTIADDMTERSFRFIEEALELVQAIGCTREQAARLVDYVYGRPAGEPSQEVGGVLVTLAALTSAGRIDMMAAAERELARISTPETIAKIRRKQASKRGVVSHVAEAALPGEWSKPQLAEEGR